MERSPVKSPIPLLQSPNGNYRDPSAGLGSSIAVLPAMDGISSPIIKRQERYLLQWVARGLLCGRIAPRGRPFRVIACIHNITSLSAGVTVMVGIRSKSAKYNGLQTCGCPWTCPICAYKITRYRQSEIERGMNRHFERGGNSVMVTYTHSHSKHQKLDQILKRLKKAFSDMTSWRAFKELLRSVSFKGRIKALENTWGESNGWHPHVHEIWLLDRKPLTAAERHALSGAIFHLWRQACVKHGLRAPSARRGVSLDEAPSPAEYIAKFDKAQKFNAAADLVKGHVRQAGGNRFTAFDMLRSIRTQNQPERMKELFREFAVAFFGKHQIQWSRGLKKDLGVDEKSDEEISVLAEEEHIAGGTISSGDWKLKIVRQRNDVRAEILSIHEQSGMTGVNKFIDGLKWK